MKILAWILAFVGLTTLIDRWCGIVLTVEKRVVHDFVYCFLGMALYRVAAQKRGGGAGA